MSGENQEEMTKLEDHTSYLPGLTEEAAQELQTKLQIPEGTLIFDYSAKGLFASSAQRAILLQVVTGKIIFRLEKLSNNLSFIHASPGEGTRIATIDLAMVKPADRLRLTFTWSSDATAMYVGSVDEPCVPVRAEGIKSTGRQLLVAEDGSVIEIGDEGVEVWGVSVFVEGNQILHSPAIDAWAEVTKAARLLLDHLRQDITNQLLKVLLANQVLSMLVTGYETYCKRRFLEMVGEGRQADFDLLAGKFFSKREREANLIEVMKEESKALSISSVELLVRSGKIDFQNYQNAKKAYSAAYGIRFGEIGIPNKTLEYLQKIIGYRHRIIHVSPLIGLLNQSNVPPEEPVFSGLEIASAALEAFDTFIQVLHRRTLEVRSFAA